MLDAAYTHIYSEVEIDHCAYCGDVKECLDHVPALTWVGSMGTDHFRSSGTPFLLVPACLECNALLGSVGLFDMDERKAFISGALRDRYRQVLSAPAWGVEINSLEQPLRQAILDKQRLARFVNSRISYANGCYTAKPLSKHLDDDGGACEEPCDNSIDTLNEHTEDGSEIYWLCPEDWVMEKVKDERLANIKVHKIREWACQGYITPFRVLDGRFEIREDAEFNTPAEEVEKHLGRLAKRNSKGCPVVPGTSIEEATPKMLSSACGDHPTLSRVIYSAFLSVFEKRSAKVG